MAYRSINSAMTSRNRLSDRDMILDILATSKSMSNLYDHASLEASDTMIRDTFEDLQHDEHRSAEMLFNIMQQQGWYNTNATASSSSRSASSHRYRNSSSNNSNRYNSDASGRYSSASSRSQFGRNSGDTSNSSLTGRSRDSNYSQQSWNV
ncbi:MAG: Coat domain protein [Firmicutes bacterium]|nr:Coat domain protein [Bacillota bacterium]